MATLFTTLIGTLTGGGGAAGAGAAAGAAAGGGLNFFSVASSVVGGLSSIMAGNAEADALEQQAVDNETRAVQEEINGRQDALDALRRLNRDQASIAVSGYASGIGGGEGSVQAAQEEAQKIGEENVNVARENAGFSSRLRRSQATQNRKSASGARLGGIFGALDQGFSLFTRRTARG